MNNKLQLALTLDYELYGNGSGNVFEDVIEPTKILLILCDKYKVKLTIYFEVVEYWKLEEEWLKGNKMGYTDNPAEAMKTQIINAYLEGHDVQLHIHPQWINAIYKNNKWNLDDNWCMKDVPLESDNNLGIDLFSLINRGKETIENLLKPINRDYKCNIFRAGGFNILPSERIFPILKRLGFIASSSVFPGGYDISKVSNIDFRNLKNDIPYWYVSNDNVLDQNQRKGGLIELPIFSFPARRLFKYNISRIKTIFKNKISSIETFNNKTNTRSIIKKIIYFFEKEYIIWDYCLFSYRKMNFFLEKALEIKNNHDFYPFILIGHSKSFYKNKSFEKFLKMARDRTEYYTLAQVVKKIQAL